MSHDIAGSPEEPFTPGQIILAEAESSNAAPIAMRRRGRLQALLAAGCALGVFAGARLTHSHRHAATSLTEQALHGVWILQSVGGEPVGPGRASAVLSQKVTFDN